MFSACRGGNVAKIVNLIEAGESPKSVNVNVNGGGSTPVMMAIQWSKLSAAKVLFGFGADLSIVDNNGINALHCAAESDDIETINWLLDNSTIDINAIDHDGWTAAILAMELNKFDAVKFLHARGADLSIVNHKGRNSLHIAARNGDVKAIKWLLENSTLDINLADDEGSTPIMICLNWNELASAKLLVERGSNLFLKDEEGTRAIDIRVLYISDGVQCWALKSSFTLKNYDGQRSRSSCSSSMSVSDTSHGNHPCYFNGRRRCGNPVSLSFSPSGGLDFHDSRRSPSRRFLYH
jgi:ankyrin repeat protein